VEKEQVVEEGVAVVLVEGEEGEDPTRAALGGGRARRLHCRAVAVARTATMTREAVRLLVQLATETETEIFRLRLHRAVSTMAVFDPVSPTRPTFQRAVEETRDPWEGVRIRHHRRMGVRIRRRHRRRLVVRHAQAGIPCPPRRRRRDDRFLLHRRSI
jgi:hypothetical protein